MKIKKIGKNFVGCVTTLLFILPVFIQAQPALASDITEDKMIELTNKSRTESGLPILSVNEKLQKAATEKMNDMFVLQYFDHNSPEGKTPWDFIKSNDYEYSYAGENLAIDFISAERAHSAFMKSSSHRDNILNENYSEIGISVGKGKFGNNESIIIVEEFGSPINYSGNYVTGPFPMNSTKNIKNNIEHQYTVIEKLPKGFATTFSFPVKNISMPEKVYTENIYYNSYNKRKINRSSIVLSSTSYNKNEFILFGYILSIIIILNTVLFAHFKKDELALEYESVISSKIKNLI